MSELIPGTPEASQEWAPENRQSDVLGVNENGDMTVGPPRCLEPSFRNKPSHDRFWGGGRRNPKRVSLDILSVGTPKAMPCLAFLGLSLPGGQVQHWQQPSW